MTAYQCQHLELSGFDRVSMGLPLTRRAGNSRSGKDAITRRLAMQPAIFPLL